MKAELCAEFEPDEYIEKLIRLRESDPVAYLIYPQAVRDMVEQYEREKKAAQQKKKSD